MVRSERGKVRSPQRLIFVSHDHQDAALAGAVERLIAHASAGILKTFRSSSPSSTGIPYGTEWFAKVMTELRAATEVILILTPRSLRRPWILFEAGVASYQPSSFIIGIVFDMPVGVAATGPFTPFQHLAADEASLTSLIRQLLQRHPDAQPSEDAIRMHVHSFLAELPALLPRDEDEIIASETKQTLRKLDDLSKDVEQIKVRLGIKSTEQSGSDVAVLAEFRARVIDMINARNRNVFIQHFREAAEYLRQNAIWSGDALKPVIDRVGQKDLDAALSWLDTMLETSVAVDRLSSTVLLEIRTAIEIWHRSRDPRRLSRVNSEWK